MKRLTVGNSVPEFVGTTAAGLSLSAQDLRGSSTLLQFHRFAKCPACFVSIREFTRRYDKIRDAGLRVVAFFYSTPISLAESFAELAPGFDLVGDPERLIFNRFGVERSAKKFLNLKAWMVAGEGWRKGARFEPVANLTKEDTTGVPADFLVDPQGTIQHVSYGRHAADSMNVDDVLRAHRGD